MLQTATAMSRAASALAPALHAATTRPFHANPDGGSPKRDTADDRRSLPLHMMCSRCVCRPPHRRRRRHPSLACPSPSRNVSRPPSFPTHPHSRAAPALPRNRHPIRSPQTPLPHLLPSASSSNKTSAPSAPQASPSIPQRLLHLQQRASMSESADAPRPGCPA